MSGTVEQTAQAEPWLDAADWRRLEQRLNAALRRARTVGSPALASLTVRADHAEDSSAMVAAARRPGEPWFCFEQPERNRSALAALGSVRAIEARGPNRFAEVARRWRALAAGGLADDADGPPGSGLVALGGF